MRELFYKLFVWNERRKYAKHRKWLRKSSVIYLSRGDAKRVVDYRDYLGQFRNRSN